MFWRSQLNSRVPTFENMDPLCHIFYADTNWLVQFTAVESLGQGYLSRRFLACNPSLSLPTTF
jgi:hypothetical protein